MLKPYVYVATGKSRDVQRAAPTGARCAIHYPTPRAPDCECDSGADGLVQHAAGCEHG